jgi:cysteine desulfurase
MNVLPERQLGPAAGLKPIYLDHHATTPVDERVVEVMVRAMTAQFGNPNDRSHVFGEEASELVDAARVEIARLVGAESDCVLLQRSATVAARAVVSSLTEACPSGQRLTVAATTVEHRAVLDALEDKKGRIRSIWIEVDGAARVSLDRIRDVLNEGCDLLCVMAANNEVGTIYPIEHIARLAREHGVPLLVDATQAGGHLQIDVNGWGVSYLLLAAHKMSNGRFN